MFKVTHWWVAGPRKGPVDSPAPGVWLRVYLWVSRPEVECWGHFRVTSVSRSVVSLWVTEGQGPCPPVGSREG